VNMTNHAAVDVCNCRCMQLAIDFHGCKVIIVFGTAGVWITQYSFGIITLIIC